MPDGLKNLDLKWCGDKTTNLPLPYNISQFDFIYKLQNAVINTRDMQINNYKARVKNRVSEEDFNKLNQAGIFDTKNMALSKNYIACGTDFHGDIYSLYSFLVQCGYLIPNKNKTLIMNFVTGEIIYDSDNTAKQNSFENIINSQANKNKELVLLPGFDINLNFQGKIKLLGDYIDRGKESAMCLALLDYLTQQKSYNNYLDVHIGNHETFATNGFYLYDYNFKKAIDRMIKNKQMTLGSLEKLPNEKYMSYAHTCLCKKHVPKMLAALVKFSKLEDYLNQPHPDITQKYLEVYKVHLEKYKKLMTEQRYSDLAQKINKINLNDQDKLLEVDNFQQTCDYLKNIGFEEKDYFMLKNFIGEIVGDFDNQYGQIGESIICFYDHIFHALNDGNLDHGFDVYWPWTMADRYSPSYNEMFETVSQIKGHDAAEELNPFTIEQDDQEQTNILDIDTLRSSGYQKKKSDSMMVIQCPNLENNIKDLFSLERYSSKRDLNDYSVTTDIIQEETFVSRDKLGNDRISKKTDLTRDKEFKSLKKYFGAYSKSYLINKDKFDLCEIILGKEKFAMDKEIQEAKAEKEAKEKAEQEAKEKAGREAKEKQESLSEFSDSAEKGDVDRALEIVRDKKQDKDFDLKLKESIINDLTFIKEKIKLKDVDALDDSFFTQTKNKLIVYNYLLYPNDKEQNQKFKNELENADKVSWFKIVITVIANIFALDFNAVRHPEKTRKRERLKQAMKIKTNYEKKR